MFAQRRPRVTLEDLESALKSGERDELLLIIKGDVSGSVEALEDALIQLDVGEEVALRVIGRYMDEQKPRDVFFLEQDNNFVLRLLMSSQAGAKHVLFEFTKEDVERMIDEGPARRKRDAAAGSAVRGH